MPQAVVGTIDHTVDAANSEWDLNNTKIIPVPADGLCMYHCVCTPLETQTGWKTGIHLVRPWTGNEKG